MSSDSCTKNVKCRYCYYIILHPLVKEEMGMQTRRSSFYLISDRIFSDEEKMGLNYDSAVHFEEPPINRVNKKFSAFRGVVCSAGAEDKTLIKKELQKYCNLLNEKGAVDFDGEDYYTCPISQLQMLKEGRSI